MSGVLRLSATTPGFDNTAQPAKGSPQAAAQPQNLMHTAIALVADDGQLNDDDLKQLKAVARADGDTEVSEALLLEELTALNGVTHRVGDRSFIDQVLTARLDPGFDPNTFVFETDRILSIADVKLPDGSTGSITQRFSNDRIDGGPRMTFTANQEDQGQSARERLQALIAQSSTGDGEQAAEAWRQIDPFDLGAVRTFLQGRPFSPGEQAEFAQNYLQGYYDHTGLGADWGGITDIQQALPHLPVDGGGRKFVECEGFSAITQQLFPQAQIFAVRDSAQPGDAAGARNHQVSVIRIGDQRFVQNNDMIQEITAAQLPPGSPALQELSDDRLIEAFDEKGTRPLTRAAHDPTPLAEGAEIYDIGEIIRTGFIEVNLHRPLDPDYQTYPSAELRVVSKIDPFHLQVEGAVSKTPFVMRFEPHTGRRYLMTDHPAMAPAQE